jgi:hypothetical protein
MIPGVGKVARVGTDAFVRPGRGATVARADGRVVSRKKAGMHAHPCFVESANGYGYGEGVAYPTRRADHIDRCLVVGCVVGVVSARDRQPRANSKEGQKGDQHQTLSFG